MSQLHSCALLVYRLGHLGVDSAGVLVDAEDLAGARHDGVLDGVVHIPVPVHRPHLQHLQQLCHNMHV